MNPSKSFSIINLGCPKNQVDAEIMLSRLTVAGWTWQPEPAGPDLIIINTCGFIEPAQQESIDTLLQAIEDFPGSRVVAAGCLSQRFADDLAEEMSELAAVFGNRSPDRIVELVDRIFGEPPATGDNRPAGAGSPPAAPDDLPAGGDDGPAAAAVPPVPTDQLAIDGGFAAASDDPGKPIVFAPAGAAVLESPARDRLLSPPSTAYVKVAEGCDHTCTFCAIPAIRGATRQRPLREIVQEVATLVERGIHEITLVAQDLAAYSQPDLVTLIREILTVPGNYWLRPLYLYPDNFPVDLAALSAGDHRVIPYFDISFQHADPIILRRMGRRGSREQYLELIQQIRERNPDTVLRTSLIVGFPGESDDSIQALLSFLDDAQLDWVGVFEFSPQEGTPAAQWVEQGEMSPAGRIRRWKQTVERHQERITRQRLMRHVGKTLDVLVEDPIAGSDLYICRGWMHAPEVDGLAVLTAPEGDYQPGHVVPAKVTTVNGIDLAVVPLTPAKPR